LAPLPVARVKPRNKLPEATKLSSAMNVGLKVPSGGRMDGREDAESDINTSREGKCLHAGPTIRREVSNNAL
jgi:hypothetical protein